MRLNRGVRSASLEELLPRLGTGDIVLFSGKSTPSSIVKRLTWSRWNHVGMVLRLPERGRPVLWESMHRASVPDAIDGKADSGVHCPDLEQRLRSDTADMAVRQLSRPVTDDMQARVDALRDELWRRPYERSFLELARSAFGFLLGRNAREDLSSVFCSELVAEAYQAMGLLPEVVKNSNEFTPAAFAEEGDLELLDGWSLGPEIVVDVRGQ